jgi:hypothetical protein
MLLFDGEAWWTGWGWRPFGAMKMAWASQRCGYENAPMERVCSYISSSGLYGVQAGAGPLIHDLEPVVPGSFSQDSCQPIETQNSLAKEQVERLEVMR